MYTAIYVYDFPSRSSKLSTRSLRVGNKLELEGVAAHRAISDGIVYGIWRAVRNGHCPLLLTYYSLFCVVSRAMRSALFAPV